MPFSWRSPYIQIGLVKITMARLRAWVPCLFALAGVAVCTWISFRFGQHLGSTGFVYLVLVVLAAVYGGFPQATVVSVVAVACLDYYFDEPIFSFTVGRFSNWVELGAFEFTALMISQLSNRAHVRELEAIAERRDTARLYQAARRTLLLDNPADPGAQVCTLIREVFELKDVVLFDARSTALHHSGPSQGEALDTLVAGTRAAHQHDEDRFDEEVQTWFCALRLGTRPAGALALCGTRMSSLTAAAVASLAAIALERARTLEKQYHAEAARQAEQLRTAVLDSLAHQFKTPLTVIRTAGSGLPAAGELSPLQTELLSLIDQEATRLNDLASRLLGAPALNSEEFAPQPEPLLFSRLIRAAVQELESPGVRERFHISIPVHEPPVFADRELILTALAQLVDNAVKYSSPGSPIDVGMLIKETSVILTIRNRGLVVSSADRERIFERFYRAPGAQRCAPGTGLGLSIVKTIAADHQGRVWAEGEPGYGTAFSFSLPIVPALVEAKVS